ncbi:MAG: DUF3106 domain-containing protein [Verrucomicrobiales bacterium]|nr:DUF3106 domain-containing protein [Verrucomicrobiales bacterium]
MKLPLRLLFPLRALLAALALCSAVASPAATPTPPPLPPLPTSPITGFRQLLALPAPARERLVSQRPEPQRAALRARLADYERLAAPDREQRLNATDLYWHMQQLLRRPAAERQSLLATAPESLRPILAERLELWDALPASDREALLQHERAIRYFARLKTVSPPPLPPGTGPSLSAAPPVPLRVQAELGPLQDLTPEQRERARQQWTQFFQAPAPRVQRALLTMDARERQAMERVLERFRLLSPDQRQSCIDSFTRFTTLSNSERAEFLRRAERWEKLPAEERAAWRQLVDKLPILPPLPTDGTPPPLPPVRQNPRLAGSAPEPAP